MGAIKDIVDLLTQLNSSILKIRTLMLTVQEEDAALVSENLDLKKKIFELEKKYSAFEEKYSAPQEKSSTETLQDKYDFIEEKHPAPQEESSAFEEKHSALQEKPSAFEEKHTAPQEKSSTENLQDKYEFIEKLGIYKSKESGDYFCTSCLMKNIESPLTQKLTGWQCELKDCGQVYSYPAYMTPKRKRHNKFFQW